MKNITDRGRKILSKVFRVISVSVVSLILHACDIFLPEPITCEYGMPYPESQQSSITGTVVSRKTGAPIFGIKVSIEGTMYSARTNEDGEFSFWVPIRDVYKIIFEDVDGPFNDGLFKTDKFTLKQNSTYYKLLISMDLDTETATDPYTPALKINEE
jgi:putative lipoprotein (rSAM/lipoprotein system)